MLKLHLEKGLWRSHLTYYTCSVSVLIMYCWLLSPIVCKRYLFTIFQCDILQYSCYCIIAKVWMLSWTRIMLFANKYAGKHCSQVKMISWNTRYIYWTFKLLRSRMLIEYAIFKKKKLTTSTRGLITIHNIFHTNHNLKPNITSISCIYLLTPTCRRFLLVRICKTVWY